ncbi:MAG: hypothetical protein Q9179_004972 [Wetmoreana sp. 5 TL-2023]
MKCFEARQYGVSVAISPKSAAKAIPCPKRQSSGHVLHARAPSSDAVKRLTDGDNSLTQSLQRWYPRRASRLRPSERPIVEERPETVEMVVRRNQQAGHGMEHSAAEILSRNNSSANLSRISAADKEVKKAKSAGHLTTPTAATTPTASPSSPANGEEDGLHRASKSTTSVAGLVAPLSAANLRAPRAFSASHDRHDSGTASAKHSGLASVELVDAAESGHAGEEGDEGMEMQAVAARGA